MTWVIHSQSAFVKDKSYLLTSRAILGRDHNCDITISKPEVSRKHAELFVEEGKLYIQDLRSNNGVFVHNQRIQLQELQIGDEFSIESVILRVAEQEPFETEAEQAATNPGVTSFMPSILPENIRNLRLEDLERDKTLEVQLPPETLDLTLEPANQQEVQYAIRVIRENKIKVDKLFDIEKFGNQFYIGRSKSCAICLEDQHVSKKHIQVFWENNKWRFINVSETNKMQVNEAEQQECIFLNKPTRIDIGHSVILLEKGNTQASPIPPWIKEDQI